MKDLCVQGQYINIQTLMCGNCLGLFVVGFYDFLYYGKIKIIKLLTNCQFVTQVPVVSRYPDIPEQYKNYSFLYVGIL